MQAPLYRLALMVDYTHAGTVEYLFLEETNEFFFLELNPRLQVRCLSRVICGEKICVTPPCLGGRWSIL